MVVFIFLLMVDIFSFFNKTNFHHRDSIDLFPVSKEESVKDLPEAKWNVIFLKTKASWYGGKFHGRKTASGDIFNKNDFTFARKKSLGHIFPFGSEIRVTNLLNGKSVIVKCNDTGSLTKDRSIDLSQAAMKELDGISSGVIPVSIEILKN